MLAKILTYYSISETLEKVSKLKEIGVQFQP